MKTIKINVDLSRLKSLGLSPNDLVYLICLHNKEDCYFKHDIANLESRGFVKTHINEEEKEEIALRSPAKALLKTVITSDENINKLVTEYRDMFPVGVKTAGQPVRGDLQACLKKMKSFKTKYDYTDNEILEATRVYLVIKKKQGWQATTCAHYFIEKNDISLLAASCEDIRKRGDLLVEDGTGLGNVKGV
jgi:hypothetical protein